MLAELLAFDEKLFLSIYQLPHPGFLDFLMDILTRVGDYGIVWLILGFWLFIHRARKNNLKSFKDYLKLLIITFLFSYILKWFIDRGRPLVGWGSFPSGHAAVSFAAAGYLTIFFKKYKFHFFTLAILISFSRVYLGYHFPGDVAAGALLGLTTFKLMNKLNKSTNKKLKNTK